MKEEGVGVSELRMAFPTIKYQILEAGLKI